MSAVAIEAVVVAAAVVPGPEADVNFYTGPRTDPIWRGEDLRRIQREYEGDPLHRLEWELWTDSLPDLNPS